MQNIPSSLLAQCFSFASTKDAFRCKSVSKHFLNEINSLNFWKVIIKAHEPALARVISDDPQRIMRDLVPIQFKLSDFEFILESNGEIIHKWQKGTRPLNGNLQHEALQKAVRQLDDLNLYVILHGKEKQYRKVEFAFHETFELGNLSSHVIWNERDTCHEELEKYSQIAFELKGEKIVNIIFNIYSECQEWDLTCAQWGTESDERFVKNLRENLNF